jgi:hypothetical protein
MIRNSFRKLALGLTIAALSAYAGTALAQSGTSTTTNPPTTTPPPPAPSSVTGTDPEPQGDVIMAVVLTLLHMA